MEKMTRLSTNVCAQSLSVISWALGALRACCLAIASVASMQAMCRFWSALFSKVSHPAAMQPCKCCVRIGCPVAQMTSVSKACLSARQCASDYHAVLHVPHDSQQCTQSAFTLQEQNLLLQVCLLQAVKKMITLPVHVYAQSLSIISQALGALRACCPAIASVTAKQAIYWFWSALFSKVSDPAAAQASKCCSKKGCPVAQMAFVPKGHMCPDYAHSITTLWSMYPLTICIALRGEGAGSSVKGREGTYHLQ